MEGIGSRTGRPSSRYGSAPVFTGPVRRWQKQWVNVSSSSSYVSYNNNNSSNSNGNNSSSSSSNNNNVSSIRIRRWTPVQSARTGGDSEPVEERPKRKVRYAPIVVLEGKKKEAEKGDVDVKEASKTDQSPAKETSENDDNEKKSSDDVLAAKSQASPQKSEEPTNDLNNQPMDLDTGGDNDNEDREDRDLGGDNKVADWVKAAQRGFAR